jgi:hypothetical protein
MVQRLWRRQVELFEMLLFQDVRFCILSLVVYTVKWKASKLLRTASQRGEIFNVPKVKHGPAGVWREAPERISQQGSKYSTSPD